MVCSKCGDRIEPGLKFCQSCGTPAPAETQSSGTTQVYQPPPAQEKPYEPPTQQPYQQPEQQSYGQPPPYGQQPYQQPEPQVNQPYQQYEPPTQMSNQQFYEPAGYDQAYGQQPPAPPPYEPPAQQPYEPSAQQSYGPPPVSPPYEPPVQQSYQQPAPPSYGQQPYQQPYGQQPYQQTAVAAPPPPPKKKGLLLAIIIPVGVVVLLAAAFVILHFVVKPDWWWFNSGSGGDGDEDDETRRRSISEDGGSVEVTRTTEFTFEPGESGTWEFRTSENDDSDPYLELLNSRGNLIAEDDDSGDGVNAFISEELEEGTEYTIRATFIEDFEGSYTLTVSRAGGGSTASPSPSPDISTSPPPTTSNTIPSRGGSVSVSGMTEYSFRPDNSGMWEIYTENNGGSDPLLTLYDSRGFEVARDDDSGGSGNSYIAANLDSRETYTIHAGFYGGGTGNYVLSVQPMSDTPPGGGTSTSETIPRGGGQMRVNGETTFTFTPNATGWWEFYTSDNGSSDPYLYLLDSRGNEIARNDDGGSGVNAYIAEYLDAGTTYTLVATFYGGGGSYNLNVASTTEPSGAAMIMGLLLFRVPAGR